ncbi:MAG: hypothetical protein JST00_42235 [Deltaproteobacteria bacterium]|nr:hypothetical protein [Deltaproteobacteria bacterium]
MSEASDTPRPEGDEAERSPAFAALLAVCAVASVVPLFCARHLPMCDLPEHLAAISTIRHYWDPAYRSSEYFTLSGFLETPYWLYHAVGALLAVVLGSAERANLLILTAAGLAYPYSLRALLLALRRDPRLALFGCALFWTNSLTTGLLNFVASVPVVLYGLALVARQVERPSRARWACLSAIALSLLYLHGVSFLFFTLQAALLYLMLSPPDPAKVRATLVARARSLPRRMAWLVPSGLAGLAVFLRGHALTSDARGKHVELTPLASKLSAIPRWLFDTFHTPVDDRLGWALVGLLALLIVLSRPRASMSFDDRWRARVPVMLAASAFLVYLAVPSRAGIHAYLLDVRCTVFVAMFAVMVPSPRRDLRGALPLAATAAVTLGLSIDAGVQVRAFEREEVGPFDELLQQMPRGARLVQLDFTTHSTVVNVRPTFFGSYYRARYGGIASFSFSEMPHWPVRYRPEWLPPAKFAWGTPCAFRNSRDGSYFDYVLTHGDVDPFASHPPGPQWERVGAARAFTLYRKLPSFSADSGADAGPCRPRM